MTKELIFVTGNEEKAKELGLRLDHPVIHRKLDIHEIQSLDIEEVVSHKARLAYEQLQRPLLVEDTSLSFSVLGRLPGTYIKFFYEELGNEGICHLMDGYEDRSATVRLVFAYYDGNTLALFAHEVAGYIADAPAGSAGFGWDSIFIPDGYEKTRGEMNEEELTATSARGMALQKLKMFLDERP